MKLLDSAFAFSETALALRNQRMEVLSRNIANADTPGFKAQDIDFKSVLNDAQEMTSIRATQGGHINNPQSASTANLIYTIPFNSSVDGNTVELSVEQAKYGRAAAQYQATLRFIEGDISGIRKALRGD
ncbi:MAG: flagellar basal-body rod protein FlgB [Porticoccaceae bacterium]|jgi:flagellar basal-body rod protein FlgB|tara:strand:- start:1381 stop:1767 length:387 start_codon:yes stop_codon:yes gene_type:complete